VHLTLSSVHIESYWFLMRVAEKKKKKILIHAMPCYTADVPVLEATNAVSL